MKKYLLPLVLLIVAALNFLMASRCMETENTVSAVLHTIAGVLFLVAIVTEVIKARKGQKQ